LLEKYIEFLQLVKNFFVINNFVQDFLMKKQFFFSNVCRFCKNQYFNIIDSTQKLKQFGPIVKFSTCNILVKSSLKIETAKLQVISIIFPLDLDFGAIAQTNELNLLFEFCVYPPRHWFNRSSLFRSSHIDFITSYTSFLFYYSELLNGALILFRKSA